MADVADGRDVEQQRDAKLQVVAPTRFQESD